MRTTLSEPVAAWVDRTAVPVSAVDEREAQLRSGPVGATLPRPHTTEGRQLRRWLVQVLVAERIVAAEAHGVDPASAPELADLAPDRAALLGLGSVAADLLTRDRLARAVFAAVPDNVTVTDAEVARFHADNPERYRVAERRVVWHAIDPSGPPDPAHADGRQRTLRRGELTGAAQDAVFAAEAGTVVGPVRDPLGWHLFRIVEIHPAGVVPLNEVREEIAARLGAAARRREFTSWLDRRLAERVRLAPGFEHPGDPSQPDNTHRH